VKLVDLSGLIVECAFCGSFCERIEDLPECYLCKRGDETPHTHWRCPGPHASVPFVLKAPRVSLDGGPEPADA
jgi:hypothetical protein